MSTGGYATSNLSYRTPFRTYTNFPSQNLLGVLSSHNREIVNRQVRVATGQRTLMPEDGAAFYALSKKAELNVRAKGMAIDNIGDAKDLLSLAEAGLIRVSELVGRVRDLAVSAGNDSLNHEQREDALQEIQQLAMAIDELVARTNFNETGPMLDGAFDQTYQVGPNELDVHKLRVQIGDFSAEALGLNDISVATSTDAMNAITTIDKAFGRIQDQLIRLGGVQSELTGLENMLSGSIPPEESVQSLYGDADLAREQLELTRLNLFSQLASGQIAASNALAGSVLNLLA